MDCDVPPLRVRDELEWPLEYVRSHPNLQRRDAIEGDPEMISVELEGLRQVDIYVDEIVLDGIFQIILQIEDGTDLGAGFDRYLFIVPGLEGHALDVIPSKFQPYPDRVYNPGIEYWEMGFLF